MLLVILGVALVAAKLAGIGSAADWPWWGVLLPFAGAAVWWAIADSTGLTRKKAMDKMEAKKQERRRKNLEALGLKRDPQLSAQDLARRAIAAKREAKRAEQREANEEVIRTSVLDSGTNSRIEAARKEPKV